MSGPGPFLTTLEGPGGLLELLELLALLEGLGESAMLPGWPGAPSVGWRS